jgi:hypothetical protein
MPLLPSTQARLQTIQTALGVTVRQAAALLANALNASRPGNVDTIVANLIAAYQAAAAQTVTEADYYATQADLNAVLFPPPPPPAPVLGP